MIVYTPLIEQNSENFDCEKLSEKNKRCRILSIDNFLHDLDNEDEEIN